MDRFIGVKGDRSAIATQREDRAFEPLDAFGSRFDHEHRRFGAEHCDNQTRKPGAGPEIEPRPQFRSAGVVQAQNPAPVGCRVVGVHAVKPPG